MVSGCGLMPAALKNDVEQMDARRDLAEKSAELSAELRDFKALKPSLTRLVSLESDLNFLLDEISRFSESNPVMFDQTSDLPADELSDTDQGNTIVYQADGSVFSSNDMKNVDRENKAWSETSGEESELRLPQKRGAIVANRENKFLPQQLVNQKVEVRSATPVISMDDEDIAKFSREENVIRNMGNDTKNIVGDISNVDRKKFFSQNQSNFQMTAGRDCIGNEVNINNNFALHLASYKNRTNATSGWRQLKQKYADTWCEVSAKLETVNVKGTDYFSLRVGGYESKEAANLMCNEVRSQGDYCQVASFSGENI